ncbi:MAG: putative sugar O-methyltransferase [Betaproteobacteria bacterium]|nr:putative sugar O-methyltransferase [Betaproteobacteria bacterium]
MSAADGRPLPAAGGPSAARGRPEDDPGRTLQLMFECLEQADPVYLPSRFWTKLNDRNMAQLRSHGIDNFKRTLARNYFTFVPSVIDSQFRFLLRHTRLRDWPSIMGDFPPFDQAGGLTRKQHWELVLFTRMLWRYAQARDARGLLRTIEEPSAGNPFAIRLDGRLISQDLANSALEYYCIADAAGLKPDAAITICELGAGYGRNAYMFLSALPNCRYVIVDIPPALYVSQQYLAPLFPGMKVFRFRDFDRDAAALAELGEAQLAFLLPHQAALLPPKSVNLFVNISSLHEMRPDQIRAYFALIDRVTRGHFYSKQWFVSKNREDGLLIRREDYPVPPHWSCRFARRAAVQAAFFEALYAIP